MRLAMRDSATRSALRHVQRRLKAMSEIFQSPEFQRELDQSRRAQEAAIQKLVKGMQQTLRELGDELTARGLPTPGTLEEWEHLARVVEMPFDTVRSGDYTFHDVFVMALAWMDREAVLRKMVPGTGREQPGQRLAPESSRVLSVAAMLEWTNLSHTALHKYAKLAGVETPRRGQRNFCYSLAEARKILETVMNQASDKNIRDKCRTALANLPQITR